MLTGKKKKKWGIDICGGLIGRRDTGSGVDDMSCEEFPKWGHTQEDPSPSSFRSAFPLSRSPLFHVSLRTLTMMLSRRKPETLQWALPGSSALTVCCRWCQALCHFWLLTTACGHQWFWKWVAVGWAVSEPPGGLAKNAVFKPRNSDTVTCGKEPWDLQKGLSSPGYYEAQPNLRSANLRKILLRSNYTECC